LDIIATKHPDANLECFRLDGALDTILAPTNLLNPSVLPHPLFHQQHKKYKITCSQKGLKLSNSWKYDDYRIHQSPRHFGLMNTRAILD